MRRLVMLASVAMLLAHAVHVGGQELGGDLRALQGKWRVWYTNDDSTVLEISGNSFTMTRFTAKGTGPSAKGTFTLDEKQNPKHKTWQNVTGGGLNLAVNKCIYELHGDTWLLVGGVQNRPEHFYSGEGPPHKSSILKRER